MSGSAFARGVVALALACGLAACSEAPAAQTAAPARPAPTAPPAKQSAATGAVSVKLADLEFPYREPGETTRNPFRFQPKYVPPPPPKPEPPPSEVRAMPVVPTGPPPPPPIPLKFIGVVTRANGVRWAVLSDGKLTLYGREADIIDGQYRIVSIGTESIELSYVDGRGRQTVRLTGQ